MFDREGPDCRIESLNSLHAEALGSFEQADRGLDFTDKSLGDSNFFNGSDTNGHVGVSDLILALEELGCMGTSNADLDNNHKVEDLRSVSQPPHVEGHQPQAQHPTSPQHRRHHLRRTHKAMVGDPPMTARCCDEEHNDVGPGVPIRPTKR